jgi:hypothetical protein
MQSARRSFFKKFFAESLSAIDELKGIPQFRLGEIQNLQDSILKDIVPVATAQDIYIIEGNHLLKKIPGENLPVIIRTFDPDEIFVLRLFDGQNSIQSVATKLEKRFSVLDPERSFKFVKAIFVEVAHLMLFVPAGKHEHESTNNG